MYLRLPVTGLVLKFKNKHIRELTDELAAHDRTLDDLWKDPFLSAIRLIQVGRAWERPLSLEEADEILDQEKEGGVNFNELTAAMAKAFWGHRVRAPKIHPELSEEDDEAAPEEDGSSKKSDRAMHGVPLGRVS